LIDGNSNGILSLAEVDKGVRDILMLPELFDLKPVIMRAFQTAKKSSRSVKKTNDGFIHRGDFRLLLKYLRIYYEYWIAFSRVDTDHDKRIEKPEFLKAAPVMSKWGIDMTDPEK
jgi:hypothetical protein